MPSRFAPRNRLAAVKKRTREDMTVTPSSSNEGFLSTDLEKDGWKQSRVDRTSRQVLQLIGNALVTEKVIREALGNNPDTSKALRLLLKKKMIRRFGNGGRTCPFHYQLLGSDLSPDDKMEGDQVSSPDNLDVVRPRLPQKNDLLTMKSELCEPGGMEPHEVLSFLPQRTPKVSRTPRDPKRRLSAPVSGEGKGKGKGKGRAPGHHSGVAEQEIPIPGWRLVED